MPVEQAEGQRKVRPAKARLRFAYDKTGGKGGAVGPERYEAVSFGPTFEVRPHNTQQLGAIVCLFLVCVHNISRVHDCDNQASHRLRVCRCRVCTTQELKSRRAAVCSLRS